MKIFGYFVSVGPGEEFPQLGRYSLERNSSARLYGAPIASGNFLRYLFRYADFDEYHLFVPRSYLAAHPELSSGQPPMVEANAPLRVVPMEDFAGLCRLHPYHAFHNPDGVGSPSWSYLRNELCPFNTPLTSVTHSISYWMEISGHFLPLLLHRPQPWDSIVCTSAAALAAMRRLFGRIIEGLKRDLDCRADLTPPRLDRIPLGVDCELYRPRDKGVVREKLGLPPDTLIVLYFGRLSHFDKADLLPLLIAFNRATAGMRKGKVLLLLAGEDKRHNYSSKLLSCAAELGLRDRLMVRTNPPIVEGPLYYASADICIFPSDNLQESFGQVLLEAMASGLPVVCPDWDGLRDSVSHGETGLCVPTYWMRADSEICEQAPILPWLYNHLYLSQSVCTDVQILADSLAGLLRSEERRKAMGAAARKYVSAHRDWRVIIQRYLVLWQELNGLARRCAVPQRRACAWFKPSYFNVFKGYASTILTGRQRVRLRAVMDGSLTLSTWMAQYKELEGIFDRNFLHSIVGLCAHGSTIRAIETAFPDKRESVRRHIMWLLKYGIIELAEPPVGRSLGGTLNETPSRGKLQGIRPAAGTGPVADTTRRRLQR